MSLARCSGLLRHNHGNLFSTRLCSSKPPDPLLLLTRYKRLAGLALCTLTVTATWWLRRRKEERLVSLLEECTPLTLSPDSYKNGTNFYRYKGCVLPSQIVLSGVLKELPSFQFRPEDVLVASFPKTGTTWVQEIVYMLTHDCRTTEATDATLETRFPYLEYPYPGLRSIEGLTQGKRLIKTHLPLHLLPQSLHTAGAKVIYITRNPRDTVVSYFHFMKLMTLSGFIGDFRAFVSDFIHNKVPYAPFMDHVTGYWQASTSTSLSPTDGAVLFITYEQLTENPTEVVSRIAKHLSIVVSEEHIQHVVRQTSFQAMASNPSVNYEHWKDLGFAKQNAGKFMRKGVVGDWRRHFPPDLLQKFKEWENISPTPCLFVNHLPREKEEGGE